MSRSVAACLVAAVLLGAGLRLYGLDQPPDLVFDEAHYVPAARVLVGLAPHPGMGGWASHPLVGRSPDPSFSHPPLGKLLIGAGMLVLGDTAVGRRIVSAACGVLTLVLLWRVAVRLGLPPRAQAVAVLALATDSLAIVQARVAMLDTLLLLASLLTLLALLAYRDSGTRWQVLGAAAAVGCALMVKESAVNVLVAGLLVLAVAPPPGRGARARLIDAALLVAGALGVYAISSLYFIAHGYSLVEWIAYRRFVTSALIGPLGPHPYGSQPWQWLLDQRAIWYAWIPRDGPVIAVAAFGNPVLWFGFLPAAAVLGWMARPGALDAPRARTTLAWFAGLFLPLIALLLGRQGFIYQHLPATAPMALAVALVVERSPRPRGLALAFAGAALAALAFFSPVVLGREMSMGWYQLIARFTGT